MPSGRLRCPVSPIALPPLHPPPAPARRRRSLRSRSPSIPSPSASSPSDAAVPFRFVPSILRGGRIRISNSAKKWIAPSDIAPPSRSRRARGTPRRAVPSVAVPRRAFVLFHCVSLPERGRRGRCRRSWSLPTIADIASAAPSLGAKRNETKRKRSEERRQPEHARPATYRLGRARSVALPPRSSSSTQLKSPSRSPSDFSRSVGTRRNTKN